MNKLENIGVFYEDADGICVYDCETHVGVSIDRYNGEESVATVEIIPVIFNETFTDNDVIGISSVLRNRLTFDRDGFKNFEMRICDLFTEAYYPNTFRTDEGFVVSIPNGFYGDKRMDISEEILAELIDSVKIARINLAWERAEMIADEYNDIAKEEHTVDSESFADDVRDALEKDFVTFQDILNFNWKNIVRHLAVCVIMDDDNNTNHMQLSFDMRVNGFVDVLLSLGIH